MTTREPIRIACEGSGAPGNGEQWMTTFIDCHLVTVLVTSCKMCGQNAQVVNEGVAMDHDRDDVLAMLDRGDYR